MRSYVQTPVPSDSWHIVEDFIREEKDIDSLRRRNNIYASCATADAICRVVYPFIENSSKITIFGALGFVGESTRLKLKKILEKFSSYDLLYIDDRYGKEKKNLKPDVTGDRKERFRNLEDADSSEKIIIISDIQHCNIIISAISGKPGMDSGYLDHRFIKNSPQHLLVVDSAFVPINSNRNIGSLDQTVAEIPANITPVPGGIGPIEMAVLAERIIKKEHPHLPSWSLDQTGQPIFLGWK